MSTSALLIVTSSAILWQGECIFFHLLLLANMPVNSFLTILCIPNQIQLQLHFNFHNPVLTHLGIVPLFIPGYVACAFPSHTLV